MLSSIIDVDGFMPSFVTETIRYIAQRSIHTLKKHTKMKTMSYKNKLIDAKQNNITEKNNICSERRGNPFFNSVEKYVRNVTMCDLFYIQLKPCLHFRI